MDDMRYFPWFSHLIKQLEERDETLQPSNKVNLRIWGNWLFKKMADVTMIIFFKFHMDNS